MQLFQSSVTTTDGDIRITGIGGDTVGASGESNFGVNIIDSAITASGAGTITIEGTGGFGAGGKGGGGLVLMGGENA